MTGRLSHRYGIGLIGCGSIAQSVHLPAVAALEQHARVIGIADPREDAARAAADRYGAQVWLSDYQTLLERSDVDVVLVLTPEFLHRDPVVDSLHAGKHVLCEKPMARTLEEADAMLAAARATGKHFMIAHSRRFNPRYQRMYELVRASEVGEVRLFRENVRRPRNQVAITTGPSNWQPDGKRPWRMLARYTGGAIYWLGSHEFDLMRWFIGDTPRSVYAESRYGDPDSEVPNIFSVTVQFTNGAVGVTDIFNGVLPDYPYYHTTEVTGTAGYLRARDQEMECLTVFRDGTTRHPANFATLLHLSDIYVSQLDAFLHSIDQGVPPPLNPEDGRGALELAIAAARSAETREVVELPLESEVAR